MDHQSLKECTACIDVFKETEISQIPCDCLFCKSCLNKLFETGSEHELLFPAKCHGKPIPSVNGRRS